MVGGFVDIIVFAVIAGVIIVRLYKVLGQHNDEDSNVRGMGHSQMKDVTPAEKTTIIPFPGIAPTAKKDAHNDTVEDIAAPSQLEQQLDAATQTAFQEIRKLDRRVTAEHFLTGAKMALEMVMEAYAKGDLPMLESLLAKPVYEQFSQAISDRQTAEELPQTTLVSIVSADILSAVLARKMAIITVKFVTEQINVVRNKEGKIIAGNPSHVERVEDIWTFERNVSSANPNWQITSVGE